MQLAGSDVPLPYYARPELATPRTLVVGNVTAGLAYTFTPAPGYIEIFTGTFFTFVCSAAVANRQLLVGFNDDSGATFLIAQAPSLQTASQQLNYSCSVGFTASSPVLLTRMTIALPIAVLPPGYSVVINADNFQAGDRIANFTITTIQVPTGVGVGDPRVPPPAPLVATPLTI